MAEVELTRQDDVAILTLNRPDQLNAITNTMIGLIEDALDTVENDDSVGLVLTGNGRGFCAGSDLKEPPSNFQDRVARMHRLMLRMRSHPKIIVAALNGLAYGGGLELAMGCCFRVAAPSARLSLPEVKLGMIPAYGGTQLLPRIVGQAQALELLIFGEPITADRAQEIGLVTSVADDPLAEAVAIVRRSTQFGQAPQRALRKAVIEGADMPIAPALGLEYQLIGEMAPNLEDITRHFKTKVRNSGAA